MGVLWRGSKEGGPSSKIFGWSGKDFFNFIFPWCQSFPRDTSKEFAKEHVRPLNLQTSRDLCLPFLQWLSLLAWVQPRLHLAAAIFILKNCNESSVRKPSILLSKSCRSTLICVFSCLIPAECFPIKKPGLRLFPGRDEGGGRGNWICQWKAWSWGLKNPFKSIYFPYRWHADWQKKIVIDCNTSISSSDE